MNVENALKYGGIILSIANLIQAKHLHSVEVQKEHELHSQGINVSKELQKEAINLNKKTYLVNMFLSLEQHFQQLNADLIGSSKESARDMFDQRNQQLQTIILSSSVMFSALSTVIIQGPLSTESSNFLVVTYSLVCSLSFGALFFTIVICIEIVMRMSRFMYSKSTQETKALKDAVDYTKDIISKIRSKAFNDTVLSPRTSTKNSLKQIAKLSDSEIKDIWEMHETGAKNFLQKREDACKDLDLTRGSSSNFDDFWLNDCKSWSDFATLTFYIGTLTLLIAAMIFMWSEYDFIYQAKGAAILAVTIIGVSLVVGVFLGISLRHGFFDKLSKRISRKRDSLESEHYILMPV